MQVKKNVIGKLSKCYSIGQIKFKGKDCFLVAAEKDSPCYLFDMAGNQLDKIWDSPGGVMSIVSIPNADGEFLATRQFYSPNDSENAKIVYVKYSENGWKVKTLFDLPFVHRFDVISRDGKNYIFACTLKSAHNFKDDWTSPGKVFTCILPDDIDYAIDNNSIELCEIKNNLTKNHGYTRDFKDGVQTAIVSSQDGIFRFTPPEKNCENWKIEKLLDCPASDAILKDLNNDGKKELIVISPFHGDNISIYEEKNNSYVKVYDYPKLAEFSHAIDSGFIDGKNIVVIGHRDGTRELLVFSYDNDSKKYIAESIDKDTGAANIKLINYKDKNFAIVTNREIDEIALYEFCS